MKKLLVVFGVVFLLSAGCDEKNYTIIIKNDSSKTVTFTYDGTRESLDPFASKTYEVKAYAQQQPVDISVPGAVSVKMDRKEDTFTFVDVKPFTLTVENKLTNDDVKIKAENYIEDDDGSTEITIKANSSKTAKIYTSEPKFTTLTPASIDWKFSNNTVSVTINPIIY